MNFKNLKSTYDKTHVALRHTKALIEQLNFHNASYELFPEIEALLNCLLEIRKIERSGVRNDNLKQILYQVIDEHLKKLGLEE